MWGEGTLGELQAGAITVWKIPGPQQQDIKVNNELCLGYGLRGHSKSECGMRRDSAKQPTWWRCKNVKNGLCKTLQCNLKSNPCHPGMLYNNLEPFTHDIPWQVSAFIASHPRRCAKKPIWSNWVDLCPKWAELSQKCDKMIKKWGKYTRQHPIM